MRLAHLSDLHLGHRRYQRYTRAHINQREADVAEAFTQAISRIIALEPDVVLVAGDVFQKVQPPNAAIDHAFGEVQRLVAQLPDAIIAFVAGNHEQPRTSESSCILELFSRIGPNVHVATSAARCFRFPARGLSILAVPDVLHGQRPPLEPDADATYNVLLLHGKVEGVRDEPHYLPEVTTADLGAQRWNYCAFGDYHMAQEIAPNAWYSGSTEFTSSNPWKEIGTPKGFILHDLATGAHEFHALDGVRSHLDLEPIAALGLGPSEVDALIAQRTGEAEIDGAVVRLRVMDVEKAVAADLDQRAIKRLKLRALNFTLDIRRAAVTRVFGQGARKVGVSLEELLAGKLRTFAEERRATGVDVDPDALVALGARYAAEANEKMPSVVDRDLANASSEAA
jgi:DNA repair exonuclease SbcCD nuclease subunit